MAGLQEGCNEMRHDIHRLVGHINYIKEEVIRFRFFYHQKARKLVRMKREQEHAFRETHKFEEARKVNQLI